LTQFDPGRSSEINYNRMEELSEMIRKYLTYLDELMVSDEKDCISLEDQQRLSCLRGKLLSYWEVNNNLQDLISQNMIKIRGQIREVCSILNPIMEAREKKTGK
jgi:hypothetical protein